MGGGGGGGGASIKVLEFSIAASEDFSEFIHCKLSLAWSLPYVSYHTFPYVPYHTTLQSVLSTGDVGSSEDTYMYMYMTRLPWAPDNINPIPLDR